MKIFNILILLISLFNASVFAQLEFSKWFLNQNTGITFGTSPPSILTGFSLGSSEGVSNICDSLGNLLFYTNGVTINNAAHNTMANGSSLFGNTSTTQSAIIVKQPGNSNTYYVFTLDEGNANNIGAHYSVVDMTLAAGLGSVVAKNIPMYSPSLEKQFAVRHCNGRDYWIVSHEANNNNFRAYLLTSNGLNSTPIISSTGIVFGGIGYPSAGEMKISPDGKRIGAATLSSNAAQTVSPCGFYLYDFDASSGIISNPLNLLNTSQAYGVEFSPDGTKFYGTRRDLTASPTSTLCQWSICSTNTSAIVSSIFTSTLNSKLGSLQRGIDNKIYLVNSGAYNMSVIHNPNNAGVAMNLAPNSLSIGAQTPMQGLPNYVTGYAKPQNLQVLTSVNCQQVSFNSPSYTTSLGCSSIAYPVHGYLWNFGDGASGSANTATISNPSHKFTNLGTYTVSLIVYSNCENDTIYKVINITTLGPSANVTGLQSICNGEKRVITASGGTSYNWSGSNVTTPTIALSPIVTTVYTVTAISGTCNDSQTFTLTVNKCTGNNTVIDKSSICFFPNPASNILNISSSESGHFTLTDISGRIIIQQKVANGSSQVDVKDVSSGIYTAQLQTTQGLKRERMIISR